MTCLSTSRCTTFEPGAPICQFHVRRWWEASKSCRVRFRKNGGGGGDKELMLSYSRWPNAVALWKQVKVVGKDPPTHPIEQLRTCIRLSETWPASVLSNLISHPLDENVRASIGRMKCESGQCGIQTGQYANWLDVGWYPIRLICLLRKGRLSYSFKIRPPLMIQTVRCDGDFPSRIYTD